MMQSLAEVEPVVLDASFECALGLSVLEVEKSLPLPPVKSGVAERFKSAMSEGFIAPSEFRRMVLAVDSSEKTLHTVEDFTDKPVRVAGKLAENKVVHTAEAVPHSPIHVADDLPEEVVNTIKDSPTTVGCVTEDLALRTVEDLPDTPNQVVGDAPKPILGTTEVSPQQILHVVEDSLETVERIAPSDPKLDSAIFRPIDGKPLQQNASVVKDLPKSVVRTVEDSPEVSVRVVGNLSDNKVHAVKTINHASFNVKEAEQVQIIAPTPLPIELPTAPVHRQELAPAVPSDVTLMLVTAAEAVADAILVSTGFSNGEGSIIARLQPEVLGGSEVRIAVKDGTLSVVINAATQDVYEMVEANRTQFEQHLADKVHSWRISVAVRRGGKSDERV